MLDRFALFSILLATSLFASTITEGGNVTQINVYGNTTSMKWVGFYGNVVLGAGTNVTLPAIPNNVSRLNMLAQDPPCVYSSISMHVLAVNATSISYPLSTGDLSKIDSLIGGGTENGSATFTSTGTYTLTTGTITSVPTVYTFVNNSPSAGFREGYLNDAAGNLVFVADVVTNQPDWNGTLSDYQIMVPTNGSAMDYTLSVDVVYSCIPPSPPPPPSPGTTHLIGIRPIDTITATAGSTVDVTAVIENFGDYVENNIVVILDCPAGLVCGGTGNIGSLARFSQAGVGLPISALAPGEYIVTVRAANGYTSATREFIVIVNPQCNSDPVCGANGYCSAGICEPKKPKDDPCASGNECTSGICSLGRCALCSSDSQCRADETCVAGSCTKVVCACGLIADHRCNAFQCCSDSACRSNESCIDNRCVAKELRIEIISGLLVENESLFVRVINGKGEGIGFATVYSDDIPYQADENGYATIKAPYYSIIYARAKDYPQGGSILNILKRGFLRSDIEVKTGQKIRIRIVDSRQQPIPNARIFIEGNELTSDSDGYIEYTFMNPGIIDIRAIKPGYQIADIQVHVSGVGAMFCSFPLFLGIWQLDSNGLMLLWILAIIGCCVNYLIATKKARIGRVKALIFVILPLILSIPGHWPFTICLMAHLVPIETIILLLIFWARRKRTRKDRDEWIQGLS